jgi:hypothetical protein
MLPDITYKIEYPDNVTAIADAIGAHMKKPDDPPKSPEPNIYDFVVFNCMFLESYEEDGDIQKLRNPISDKFIRDKVQNLEMLYRLRNYFTEGKYFCPTVIGCEWNGDELTDTQIANKLYFRELHVEPGADQQPSGRVYSGYTKDPNYVYMLQPAEIRNACTFPVGHFKEEQKPNEFFPFDMDQTDRTRLITAYTAALINLQRLFQEQIDKYNRSIS